MKKIRGFRFIIYFLIIFLVLDQLLGSVGVSFLTRSGWVWEDDYMLTRRDHPDKVWDRVFFGGSLVYAAYREDTSSAGYVNFGIDDGSVRDIDAALEKGIVHVGSDLVVGVNLLSFLDSFQTNPTYAWHREWYEPYAYFYRDDWKDLGKSVAKKVIRHDDSIPAYTDQEKTYYHGVISPADEEKKLARFKEEYWNQSLDGCEENLASLKRLIRFCGKKGIRLRLVWMPRNPSVEKPALLASLMSEVASICGESGIEVKDMTDDFDEDCFYDFGHMNYEYGAYQFTEAIDPWLKETAK